MVSDVTGLNFWTTVSKCRASFIGIALFILILQIYLVDGRSHLLGQSGDTDSNQLLPIALLAGDGFDFHHVVAADNMPYALRRTNGHVLALYPILPGIINTLTYVVAKGASPQTRLIDDRAYLSLITGAVVSGLSVGIVYLILIGQGLPMVGSAMLALVYGLGTSVFSVASRGIWQHGPAILFLSCALLILGQGRSRFISLAGLCLGLAVECRVPVLLLALPLFVIPWWQGPRYFASFLLGFVLPIGLMRVYAWHYWGSPFVLAENMGNVGVPFVGDNPIEGLLGILVSPGRGLLVYSPFILFGAAGGVSAFRSRDGFLVPVATGIILYVLTVAFWHSWVGGKSFGTRMLTEIFPGGMVLAARPLATWWGCGGPKRAVATIAIGWSVLVNYAGARHYPQLPFYNDKEERETAWSLQKNELVACLDAMRLRVEDRIGIYREPR